MAKMGRPPIDGAKKTSVNIRVTEDQRKALKTRASAVGMTLSEYVLYTCMKDISENEFINKRMK